MTNASAFTTEPPYLTTLADRHGRTWQFAYWGSGFIYIREILDVDGDPVILPAMGNRASRSDWPYSIGIGDYINMTPERVTHRWLTERVASWVSNRSSESREDTP